jgi:hypothetical protein
MWAAAMIESWIPSLAFLASPASSTTPACAGAQAAGRPRSQSEAGALASGIDTTRSKLSGARAYKP